MSARMNTWYTFLVQISTSTHVNMLVARKRDEYLPKLDLTSMETLRIVQQCYTAVRQVVQSALRITRTR